jgi:hypothetical protein
MDSVGPSLGLSRGCFCSFSEAKGGFMRVSASLVIAAAALSHAAQLSVPSDQYKSIAAALTKAQDGDTVWVADGTYRETVLLNPGVLLKARTLHKAILDGGGRGTVVTLAHGAGISGMVIRNGTIGIVSKSANAAIQMCRVERNAQSGIMCVGHLPNILDNTIVFNKGSGIQGWDLRSTNSAINHNTIAYNENHGIALGGNSDVIVENCIIAFNGQFGVKSESSSVKARVVNSNLYRNGADVAPLGNGCISVDPLFADAHRMGFTLGSGSGCIRAAADGTDLGPRFAAQ